MPHILVENKEQHEESTRMLQDAVNPSGKVITLGRRQSKASILSTNVDQNR